MSITRRLFLRNSVASGAVAATIMAPLATEAAPHDAGLTAIPSEVFDKIKAWQAANRENVRATNAYSEALREKPIDKGKCGQCFADMVHTEQEVGPAREAMIIALQSV